MGKSPKSQGRKPSNEELEAEEEEQRRQAEAEEQRRQQDEAAQTELEALLGDVQNAQGRYINVVVLVFHAED